MKHPADFPRQSRIRAAAFSLLLALSLPRVRAENGISYKYEDYREAGGRIAVQTQGALIEQSLGTEMKLKLEGVIDAIAGATPDGRPAPPGATRCRFPTCTSAARPGARNSRGSCRGST